MGIIDGDLVPSTSGTSHLGVDARGATNFDISSLSPFGHVHQLSGVFHNESGSSGILRFGAGKTEVSNDGGINFYPIATDSLPGTNNDVFFRKASSEYDVDTLGLRYNKTQNILGISGAISMTRVSLNTTDLQRPRSSGTTEIVTANFAERGIIGVQTSGQKNLLPHFMQPALFNKFAFMIFPNTGTTIGFYGGTLKSYGTTSHTTPNPGSGKMVNFATANAAGSHAGTGANSIMFIRGGISGIYSGFFFAARIALPDTSYNTTDIFVGLTSDNMDTAADDPPPGETCGFRHSVAGGTPLHWDFVTTAGIHDTGAICAANRIYDMYIYSPPFPADGVMYWTIRDVVLNTIYNGYVKGGDLPSVNTLMRAGLIVTNTVNGVVNIMLSHVYCEGLF